LETTRGRTENTVLRAAPALFGLYSIATLLYLHLSNRDRKARVEWIGRSHVTFSDAITAVRRSLWSHWAFATHGDHEPFAKLRFPFGCGPRRAVPIRGKKICAIGEICGSRSPHQWAF
jgi:hypothetical protein